MPCTTAFRAFLVAALLAVMAPVARAQSPLEIPPPPTTAAIPAAAPLPEPPLGPAFIAPATTPEQDKAEAWECFAKGWTVRQVREDFCVLMDTASAWYAEWKRAQVPA